MNLSPQKREHIRWFYRVGLSLLVPVLTFVLTIMSLIMENDKEELFADVSAGSPVKGHPACAAKEQ